MELLLLSQFNLDSKLPTFFELVLQDRLSETLRDLFRFIHNTLADRMGGYALTTLPYSTEVFYVLWTLIERLFLKHFDATFSESCYDMKRMALVPKIAVAPGGGAISSATVSELPTSIGAGAEAAAGAGPAPAGPSGVPLSAGGGGDAVTTTAMITEGIGGNVDATVGYTFKKMGSKQRILSLLLVTLVPYLRTKLQAYYKALTDTSPDAQLLRESAEENSRWRKGFNKWFLIIWPWVQLCSEVSTLVYWVRYMFDRSPYCSPSFHWQGLTLLRLEREDYMARQNPASASGSLLRWGFFALNSVVVGMRFLQWWQSSRNSEEVAGSLNSEALAIPPPPGPTPVHESYRAEEQTAGRSGDVEAGKCPVCRNSVANPAVNIASGYVFCYPCLQQQVLQRGLCPVTHLETNLQHIRRLYEM